MSAQWILREEQAALKHVGAARHTHSEANVVLCVITFP